MNSEHTFHDLFFFSKHLKYKTDHLKGEGNTLRTEVKGGEKDSERWIVKWWIESVAAVLVHL